LSPKQRALAWRFATHYYVQEPAEAAEMIQKEIDTLLGQGAVFCWKEIGGERYFGYETSRLAEIVVKGKLFSKVFVDFWPLSKPDKAHVAGGIPGVKRTFAFPLSDGGRPTGDEKPDPTDPVPAEAGASPAAAAPVATLGNAVTDLNARTPGGPKIVV